MLKSLLNRSLAAICLLAFGLQLSAQTPFWSETFADQASSTTNWVAGGTNGGAETWTWTDDALAGVQGFPAFASASAADGYFYFNSDANGEFDHDVTLSGVGNPADCSGKTDVHLRFYAQFAKFTETSVAQVGVSLDAGATWTYHDVFSDLPPLNQANPNAFYDDVVDVDIDEADGQAQVWFQIRWVGNYEYHWKVDDLELYEYVTPTYNVTFKVNLTNETVAPEGAFLAGSFNGFSDEAMTNEGNGVWSLTKTLTEGTTYQYKFKNGPGGWEAGQAACGVSDGFGGYNRTITPTADITLPAVCFNSCAPCVLTCASNPNSIICDDFETYNVGNVSPQAAHWIPWDLNDNSVVGSEVSTEFASNGTKSMKVKQEGAGDDQLLRLGNKTAGHYSLKWKQYVPAGKAAYINIQTDQAAPGASSANFSGQVYFNADGTLTIDIPLPATSGVYPQGEWFDVAFDMDLDNNIAKLSIAGVQVRAWEYTQNFGAIDFYAADATYLFYVDQVEYVQEAPVVFNADLCETAVDLSGFFGKAAGVVTTSAPFDITNATVGATDPTEGIDCWFDGPSVDGTHWFSFTGDGQTYEVTSSACGANPITDGDTQFALYTGECGAYSPLDCNDDVSTNDYTSTLTINTEPGESYYLMVDSYQALNGTYCLNVQAVASITCAQGQVGEAIAVPVVCWGDATAIAIDEAATVIPNLGPQFGISWALSSEPLTSGLYPILANEPSVIATFVTSPDIFTPGLPNDGTINFFTAPGIYYFTPVVLAGGTLINPAVNNFMSNIDITNGCYFVGTSVEVLLSPELQPIIAFAEDSPAGGGNVNIELTVAGGFAEAVGDPSYYQFLWSNGATTQNLTNVPAIDYTVTITDPTGCVEEFVLDVTSTTDPSSVKNLQLTPNPTTGLVTLNLSLEQAANVQIEVVNSLGQVMQSLNAGRLSTLSQPLNLSNAPAGMYTIRLRMDNETAVRRVSVQR